MLGRKVLGREKRLCEGPGQGRCGKGFGFCPKVSETPLENCKQVGSRMLWVELCPPPKIYVGVLMPSVSECDLVWR